MALEGMDVDQINSLIQLVGSTQQNLTQQLNSLNSAIQQNIGAQGSAWVGIDATTFSSSWPSEYFSPLNSAINRLGEVQQKLQAEVSAQVQASAS